MGLHGYLGAHSMPSLIGGTAIGLIEIFLAALSKTNPRVGFIGAAVVALLASGNWIGLLVRAGKLVIYPELVGLILSLGLALYLVGGHVTAKRRSRGASSEPPTA